MSDIYLSWAVLYEGTTDQAYFDVLIPRLMEELVRLRGKRNATVPSGPTIVLRRQAVAEVAREACKAREAFHLVFIHADTGGRGLETEIDSRSVHYCEAMHTVCAWPPQRCVAMTPRHETEAWMLGDPRAVTDAFGYRGSPADLGLPLDAAEAERLGDPKAVLHAAMAEARGRRRPGELSQVAAAIAQRQEFVELRKAASFAAFEASVLAALADLGSVE